MTETGKISARIRRPRRVSLLAFSALALAVWNGIRLGEAIFLWQTLREYEVRPGSLYLVISGGVWLFTGLILSAGLWLGRTWALYAAIGSVAGYTVWVWFDRLVLEQSHANWPFTLTFSLACLCIILILLFSRRTTTYFTTLRKSNDPQ